MSQRIGQTLDRGGVLLVEAPTGVGKSLAYLVPASLWALRHGPVVVSSFTRNLQDQIVRKDAPLLKRIVHPDLRVTVLKGRTNYVCRRRWEVFRSEEGSTMEGEYLIQRLEAWVQLTETGDVSEIPELRPAARRSLRRVTSEGRFCRNPACTPESGCFYKAARRRTKDAHIVVVNHSLLLADLAASGEILPEARAVIIDEAHHLVNVTRDQLAVKLDRRELEEAVGELGGLGDPGATDALRRIAREVTATVRRTEILGELRKLEAEARRHHERIQTVFSHSGAGRTDRFRVRYRTAEEGPLAPDASEELAAGILRAGRTLRGILEKLEDVLPGGALDERRQRVEASLERVTAAAASLRHLAYPDDPARVYAYETSPVDGLRIRSVPMDVGTDLREKLFYAKDAVVLTSATLAVGGDMKHVARDMGLEDGTYAQDVERSAFDLREQVLARGSAQGPSPQDRAFDRYVAEVVAAIAGAVPRKMLVLFTSHDLLAQVGENLRSMVEGVPVFEQARGGGDGARLAEEFRKGSRGILLGTASFWEGVDFPGEDLEILVLTRLPFAVPTDPLEEALVERLREDGGDPFRERSLPQAVLRFRQGFGRLIRRRTDRGVFVVLDPRIFRARYGEVFREALGVELKPLTSIEDLKKDVSLWFSGHRRR
jgi:DNA polymerase-3 subunit epsilon/ATP-dependent DNA helicase DinG